MPSVLITGANRGLGLQFAREYAQAGWRVHAACRRPAEAGALAELARDAGVNLLQIDVGAPPTIAAAAASVRESLDVLINCAGVMGQRRPFGSTDYAAFEEVLRVNTVGPLRVSEAFAEHVARSERRVLVTITSGLGSIGNNTSGGWLAYRTSKAAVNMVMRSLAVELAPRGITCVVVNPGWVQTDMGGANAPLTPGESVGAMRALIERLRPADSGAFFNYDGKPLPW